MADEGLREDGEENAITVDMRWAHERADELVAAGHPWEDVKLVLQMEANAFNEFAKLTSDQELADYIFAEYSRVIETNESRKLKREEFEPEIRDAEAKWLSASAPPSVSAPSSEPSR